MVTEQKLQQLIVEFQATIKTPPYNTAIERILRWSQDHGIDAFMWDKDYSKCQTSPPERGLPPCLWIKRMPVYVTHKELMFDILHELGHAFDPVKLPSRPAWFPGTEETEAYKNHQELERQREIRAWQWADRKFTQYPELQPDQDEYEAYREFCLKSYKVTWRQYTKAEPINF